MNLYKNIYFLQVNDYPDFLSGEERENTQHLVVTYWTNDSKRRSIRRSKRSPRPGSAATEGDRFVLVLQ